MVVESWVFDGLLHKNETEKILPLLQRHYLNDLPVAVGVFRLYLDGDFAIRRAKTVVVDVEDRRQLFE